MAQEERKHTGYNLFKTGLLLRALLLAHKGINCKQQQGTVQEVIPPDVFKLTARQGNSPMYTRISEG